MDPENLEIPWHPKITPYRLTVLATTIGLGTAKAIATQVGSTKSVLTTLEWVSGTVIFLILFIVNPYDSGVDAPRYLSWLFEPDCMDLIWRLLTITFSVPRPNYQSHERILYLTSTHPPITTYRFLVCFSVVAFGVSKATFSYLGFSTAATWTDWVLGALITSIFYCLGLYETSPSNMWPSFFADDQRQYLYSASAATAYTAGMALSVMWIFYWKGFLSHAWRDSTFAYIEPDSDHPFIGNAFNVTLKYFLLELMTLSIAIGIICLGLVLRLVAIPIMSRVGTFRVVSGRLFGTLLPSSTAGVPLTPPSFIPNRYFERTKTFFHVCIHIALHICALSGCLALSFLVTGVVAFVWDLAKVLDIGFFLILFALSGFYVNIMAFMAWLGCCFILSSMIIPLWLFVSGDYVQFRRSLIFS